MWVLLCIVAALGFNQLKFAADYTSYFSEEDVLFNRFEAFQRQFSQTDELILIIESPLGTNIKQHQPFVENITTELSQLPFIDNVGGFKSQDFSRPISVLPIFTKQSPVRDEFLAQDNSAILLTLAFKSSDSVPIFLAKIESVKTLINHQTMQYGNDIDVYYSGELALNWQYVEVIKHDLMWSLPGLVVLLSIMLFFIVSEKWWIAGIIFSSLVTLICTIGLASWANFTLAAISAFVPIIIVILNVAYSMHLYFD